MFISIFAFDEKICGIGDRCSSFSFPFLEILPHGIEIIGPARWRKAGAVELQSGNENVQINFNRVVSASCDCIDLWVLLFLRL